jgi:hypothetical protein
MADDGPLACAFFGLAEPIALALDGDDLGEVDDAEGFSGTRPFPGR